jgi:hypothetical protein
MCWAKRLIASRSRLVQPDLVANSGCTLTQRDVAIRCESEGANLFGSRLYRTDFQKAHFAAQSLRSVTRPVQIFGVLIFGSVLSIELKLVWADGTRLRILLMPWSTRPQIFQSIRFLVSGGCREGHTGNSFGDRHRAWALRVVQAGVVAETGVSSTGRQVVSGT